MEDDSLHGFLIAPFSELLEPVWFERFAVGLPACVRRFAGMAHNINLVGAAFIAVFPKSAIVYFTKDIFRHSYHSLKMGYVFSF